MTISVVVPTYKRSNELLRLLQSLSHQTVHAEELIIIVGPDDTESILVIEEWRKTSGYLLTVLVSSKASVVHAINLGFEVVTTDVICLLDDDVALPESWLRVIKKAFMENPGIGAYGGRDHLKLIREPHLSDPPPAESVGKYKWNGVLVGNHHCGSLVSPTSVDVLKGCNLSFRRAAFKVMRIEPALEFKGAETCWEIDICQQVAKAGYDVVYDNRNFVYHFAASRAPYDNRGELFSPSWSRRIYNEALMTAKFRPRRELILFLLKSFLIGTRFQPGLLWSVFLLFKYSFPVLKLPWLYAGAAQQGALKGMQLRNSSLE